MTDLVMPFRKNGVMIGFAASNEKDFVLKPSKCEAWILPLEKLRNNLRLMVKNKQARIIKAGDTEAVHITKEHALRIFQ